MIHERGWTMKECAGAGMGDARLTGHLIKPADRLGGTPSLYAFPERTTDEPKRERFTGCFIRRGRRGWVGLGRRLGTSHEANRDVHGGALCAP